ncbi:hypothetical protein T484DRAFT_3254438 [Baffinella frigidus]|nr:hypothetical protein T484DRAFT_3254438 [Cryptophyta sp. CCMP2293]
MLSGPRESALAMELDAHNALLKRNASTIQKLDNEVVSERVMEYIHGAKKREDTLVKSKDSQLDAKSRKKAKEDLDHLPEAGCPLIICAPPGSGRTATIAHLAEKFSHTKEASHFALIYRCIGATPLSSDGRLLLDGLCQDLSRLLATPRLGARPPSYNHLLREFMEQLRMLGNKKPVVLFLDGLDNLPATDHARRLAWLPRHLPSNVLVIASCRQPPKP